MCQGTVWYSCTNKHMRFRVFLKFSFTCHWCPCIYASMHLCIHASMHPHPSPSIPIHPSIHPSIHPWMDGWMDGCMHVDATMQASVRPSVSLFLRLQMWTSRSRAWKDRGWRCYLVNFFWPVCDMIPQGACQYVRVASLQSVSDCTHFCEPKESFSSNRHLLTSKSHVKDFSEQAMRKLLFIGKSCFVKNNRSETPSFLAAG